MTQLLPPKKEVALALLERSNVDVYLDPRAKGVVVPPQFRKEPRLILKIGLNMPVPIPDLRLDDESMSCTLSFKGTKFFCVVPWLSVFAMVGDDGRGMVWPDDVPQELAVRVDDNNGKRPPVPAAPESSPTSSRGRGGPRSKGPRSVEADNGGSDSGGPKSKRPRKKKDEAPARPMLVAVPSPAPSSPKLTEVGAAAAAKEAAKEKEGPPSMPSSAGAGTDSSRLGGGDVRRPPPASNQPARPKRELPPYLRVVK